MNAGLPGRLDWLVSATRQSPVDDLDKLRMCSQGRSRFLNTSTSPALPGGVFPVLCSITVRYATGTRWFAMTPDAFRRLALSQPEVVEVYCRGHSEFRVLRRSFASLGGPADSVAMVQLTSEQQAMFTRAEPRTFVPVPGGSGWLKATNVVLVCANETIVESALLVAWRNIAPISRLKSTDGSKIDGEIVDGDEGEQCISIHGADNTLKAICEEYIKLDGKNLRSAGWREQILELLVYPTPRSH